MEQSPVEWVARPEAKQARPGAQPARPEIQTARHEVQPARQASGLSLQAWLDGPQAWLDGPQAWLDDPEGGTDGWMDKQKISAFYRTSSPIGAAALLPPMKTIKISFKNKSRAGQGNR